MVVQLFVVPGTFGDWNSTRSPPIEQQQDGIVAKINGYWDWVQSQVCPTSTFSLATHFLIQI